MLNKKVLSIDIETYSSVDIRTSGLYKYVDSEDFEILLVAYSFGSEDVKIVDLASGEQLSEDFIAALLDKSITKSAYNATFEWYALSKFYETPIEQWSCTMVKGLYSGYPAGLQAIGEAIGLDNDKKKLTTGRALIKTFCVPCKATKTNGGRLRNLPQHEPDKWELFKNYCVQDVVTEKEIKKILDIVDFPQSEQEMWIIDVKMNAKGVLIDRDLVDGAIDVSERISEELLIESKEITKLVNPNSVAQLKGYLEKETGKVIDSLSKEFIPTIIEDCESVDVKRVLEIRQELGKTSVKKYTAMRCSASNADNRVRGLLQFYGANRTGRWAGRLVQVQNLPRNYLDTLNYARGLVKNRSLDNIKVVYRKRT